MAGATMAHVKAMYRCMAYCVGRPDRGLWLEPNQRWDGNEDFEFVIGGASDSDFSKDETRKSVSGWVTTLCGAVISSKSKMQTTIALSVTEAELKALISLVQDMLYEMHVIESLGLRVEKPMKPKVDNKGCFDLCHNWSVGGRTRHMDCGLNFLRELKEQGILWVVWGPGEDNEADIFTKNLGGPTFDKHCAFYCGPDARNSLRESVRVRDTG